MKVEEAVSVAVNNPVAWLTNLVEFDELLADSAEGIDVGEGVVTGEVGGPGPRDKVMEPSRKWFNLPSPVQQVVVWESHDPSRVARNEEIALELKRGDAREELHHSYGRAPETAGDPLDHKILNACHMPEILEGAFPVKRVPQWQPIGKYRDHAGIVAHDPLPGSQAATQISKHVKSPYLTEAFVSIVAYMMGELKVRIEEKTKIMPNISWRNGVFLPLPGVIEGGLPDEGKSAPAGTCIVGYKMF